MPNLAVPTPYTWLVGDIATAALLNAQLRDGLTYMLNPPLGLLVQTATSTTIPNTTWTAIAWADAAGVVADTYGGYNAGANTRYTAQVAGWYTVGGVACIQANATGSRGSQIWKNGAGVAGHATLIGPVTGAVICSVPTPVREVYLAVGDYVELKALQYSGGSLSTYLGGDLVSSLSVRWSHA